MDHKGIRDKAIKHSLKLIYTGVKSSVEVVENISGDDTQNI